MKKTMFLICLVFAAALSSCSLFSSAPVKHYYQIYYQPKPAEREPIKATVRVKAFDVDKIYKMHNLVYRSSFEEMFYYNTHFWAARPADMITDIVANHITKRQVFSDIIYTMDKKPDYVITGRVLALDEITATKEKSYARVSIIFELKDYKTDTVLLSHSFEKRKECAAQKPVYVVRAMSEIIDAEIETFIDMIYEQLAPDQQTGNE